MSSAKEIQGSVCVSGIHVCLGRCHPDHLVTNPWPSQLGMMGWGGIAAQRDARVCEHRGPCTRVLSLFIQKATLFAIKVYGCALEKERCYGSQLKPLLKCRMSECAG